MKILIPTDFSENAQYAAEYALKLFEGQEVEFILMNSWEPPHSRTASLISLNKIMKQASEEELTSALEHFKEINTNPKITVRVISEKGSLLNVVNRIGTREEIDLVIMGTRGASGMKEVLAGSNTASVIQTVKWPLLAIPHGKGFEAPKTILCAYDGKPAPSGAFLSPLRQIAQMFDAKVSILNVVRPGKEVNYDKDWISANLDGVRHHFVAEENTDVSAGINNYLEKNPAQMMVVTPKKYSYFSRFFHTSVTKKMAFHGHLPLLALNDES